MGLIQTLIERYFSPPVAVPVPYTPINLSIPPEESKVSVCEPDNFSSQSIPTAPKIADNIRPGDGSNAGTMLTDTPLRELSALTQSPEVVVRTEARSLLLYRLKVDGAKTPSDEIKGLVFSDDAEMSRAATDALISRAHALPVGNPERTLILQFLRDTYTRLVSRPNSLEAVNARQSISIQLHDIRVMFHEEGLAFDNEMVDMTAYAAATDPISSIREEALSTLIEIAPERAAEVQARLATSADSSTVTPLDHLVTEAQLASLTSNQLGNMSLQSGPDGVETRLLDSSTSSVTLFVCTLPHGEEIVLDRPLARQVFQLLQSDSAAASTVNRKVSEAGATSPRASATLQSAPISQVELDGVPRGQTSREKDGLFSHAALVTVTSQRLASGTRSDILAHFDEQPPAVRAAIAKTLGRLLTTSAATSPTPLQTVKVVGGSVLPQERNLIALMFALNGSVTMNQIVEPEMGREAPRSLFGSLISLGRAVHKGKIRIPTHGRSAEYRSQVATRSNHRTHDRNNGTEVNGSGLSHLGVTVNSGEVVVVPGLAPAVLSQPQSSGNGKSLGQFARQTGERLRTVSGRGQSSDGSSQRDPEGQGEWIFEEDENA